MIPKLIHQTYSNYDELSPLIKDSVDDLKYKNPKWVYHFYDDKDIIDFISSRYDYNMLKIYLKINPKYGAARADFFRYLLMYEYGGVYLDIKSTFNYPIDSIINDTDEYILSTWEHWGHHNELSAASVPNGKEFQQWHIICRPKHMFLKAVIFRVINEILSYSVTKGVGKDGVLRVTGPIPYTLGIFPLLSKHNHRFIKADKDKLLSYTVFSSEPTQQHVNVFKTHYSKISEPIILM